MNAILRNSLDLMAAHAHDGLCKKPPQSATLLENKANKVLADSTNMVLNSGPMQQTKRIAVNLRFPTKASRETIKKAAKAAGQSVNTFIIRAALAKAQESENKEVA